MSYIMCVYSIYVHTYIRMCVPKVHKSFVLCVGHKEEDTKV